MAKLGVIGSTAKSKRIKRTKSPRTKPKANKRKPYRGQGRV
jgi:hypothetical protein